jgi:hypothetical protein
LILWARGMVQVIEGLPSRFEDLISNPSTAKREGEEEGEREREFILWL